MEALVRHLVEPLVQHPEAISIKELEGEAVLMIELVVHPDDHDVVEGEKGRTLRSIRNVISAAAGHRKATLDLLEEHGAELEE